MAELTATTLSITGMMRKSPGPFTPCNLPARRITNFCQVFAIFSAEPNLPTIENRTGVSSVFLGCCRFYFMVETVASGKTPRSAIRLAVPKFIWGMSCKCARRPGSMPADIVREDDSVLAHVARKTTPAAALAALGIVYGDLGTSPLHTLQAVLSASGGHFSPEALGSLSLIFWALIITISVKYCLFVMRADNHGKGGILALMSMTGSNWSEGRRVFIVTGLFDTCSILAAVDRYPVNLACYGSAAIVRLTRK
jgi:hypothetical protein